MERLKKMWGKSYENYAIKKGVEIIEAEACPDHIKVIAEYIRNQLEEDYAAEQISIKEFIDPFTGNKKQ